MTSRRHAAFRSRLFLCDEKQLTPTKELCPYVGYLPIDIYLPVGKIIN